jgi:hypothetical protein
MSKLSVRIPAEDGALFSQEAADSFVGQRFHVLLAGTGYLARVTRAELYDQGASVELEAEVEVPEEEPVPEPLELADDDCLRMTPEAECPAAGSPRCKGCVWRPADE